MALLKLAHISELICLDSSGLWSCWDFYPKEGSWTLDPGKERYQEVSGVSSLLVLLVDQTIFSIWTQELSHNIEQNNV